MPQTKPDILSRAKAAVLGALAGDSLSLGVHWEYDTATLLRTRGRVETLQAPAPGSYHKNRGAGQFTHYGDQCLVLLQSVAENPGFDPAHFFQAWQELFTGYDGYMDMATKKTLQRIEFGEGPDTSGSPSDDLAGASRLVPLVLCLHSDPDGLAAAARAQTAMTHNNPLVLDSAEFFARACALVLAGEEPVAAMRRAAEAEYQSPVAQWTAQGLESADTDTVAAIAGFGQSCHTPSAFPGVAHLVARYQNDYRTCMVECAMAGGDSAARALLAGMLLGAHLGLEALPTEWIHGLAEHDRIMAYLDRF